MKKSFRLVSLSIAAAVLATCMAGCASSGTSSSAPASTPASTASKGGKITISQQKAEIADALKEMAQKYTEETGVEVEIWAQAGDAHYTNLKTNLSSESGPTIFTLNSDTEISEVKDYLTDLSDLSFIGKVQGDLLAKRDDKIVGVPMTAEGFGLVYNKTLADPATLTSTEALTKFITEQKTAGVTGLGLSQEDYFLAGHMFNFPFAVQEDPIAFCQQVFSGEVKLADVTAFQEYAKVLFAIRENQKNPIEVTYDNNCGDFATGKTAMIHQGNWCNSVIAGFSPTFEMGMMGLPVDGNTKICVGVPSVWAVNGDASAEEQQLGKDFLNWMYTSETGISYMMDKFGFIPVVDGMESKNADPLSTAVAQAISKGDILPWTFNSQWPAGIIDTELAPITQEFFTTDMSEADYLTKINDAFVTMAQGA